MTDEQKILEDELFTEFMLNISNANAYIPYDSPNTKYYFNILTCMNL